MYIYLLPQKLYFFVSGSTDGGIHMSDVVCESKMYVDDTQI